MALVDADVLIDYLRGYESTNTWLASLPEAPNVPGFVAMELYQGCHDKREADAVTKLLRQFLVVWPSPLDANTALLNFATLKLSHSIGLLDCLIAACAVEREATLYTFNVKHYVAYPGLTVEKPYSKS